MNKYQLGKARVRCEAIEFQLSRIDKVMSWKECLELTEHFYALAKRYGLVKEFKENGVI